jgi:CDGSH-type Zn-finger protein
MVAYASGLLIGGAVIGYLIGTKLASRKARCNHKVKLDSDKVVDSQDLEDIGEKKAFCRCWNSKKFPYCDGSHK